MSRPPRIVISGQIPPPIGGQALMIQRLLEGMRAQGGATVEHLPFYFTTAFHKARRASIAKVCELVRVLFRLVRLRAGGRIDQLVFAPGGPQRVPLARDLLLLPWILLASRKVVLHFHAGGIRDLLDRQPGWLVKAVSWLYSKADAAVVMTPFNRRDPESCGIREIAVIPHLLEDDFCAGIPGRQWAKPHLLYVGNLHDDKGTGLLLEAFSHLIQRCPDARLELAGECHPPYSAEQLLRDLESRNLQNKVNVLGKISGPDKLATFARANCFVFPTIAPSESFGLVMVEALMWGMPVVASDWRGNRDVLAGSPGGLLFAPAASGTALRGCLLDLYDRFEDWEALGAANRQLFLETYCRTQPYAQLEKFLLQIAGSR